MKKCSFMSNLNLLKFYTKMLTFVVQPILWIITAALGLISCGFGVLGFSMLTGWTVLGAFLVQFFIPIIAIADIFFIPYYTYHAFHMNILFSIFMFVLMPLILLCLCNSLLEYIRFLNVKVSNFNTDNTKR